MGELGKDELDRYKPDPEELNVCMYDDTRVHVTYLYMLDRDKLDTDGLGKDELDRYKLDRDKPDLEELDRYKPDPEELNVCVYDDVRVHVTYLYMLDTGELDTDGLGKDELDRYKPDLEELDRYKLDPEELNVCVYARVHVTYLYMPDTGELDVRRAGYETNWT